jgi:hypothetical protein
MRASSILLVGVSLLAAGAAPKTGGSGGSMGSGGQTPSDSATSIDAGAA